MVALHERLTPWLFLLVLDDVDYHTNYKRQVFVSVNVYSFLCR